MPSLQSRLFYFALMNRHLLQLRWKREAWDFNTSVPEFRRMCEQTNGRLARLPEEIEVTPAHIEALPAGLSAEWIRPSQTSGQAVIFYVHGGGYISGSCNDHRAMVAKLVKASGLPALLYEYRLAPEHPFPAALDDSLAVYQWLLAQGKSPEQIVMVGESAGGGLELALLLVLRDRGLPLPRAVVAMSPSTDLKLTGESMRTKAKVCMSPPGMAEVCSRYYAGEHDPGLPYISPLYGDLHGLPPLSIYVGEYETLLDDSTRFAAKAKAAGVEVTLHVGPRMVHCYPLLAPLFPEATQALEEIGTLIRQAVTKESEYYRSVTYNQSGSSRTPA